jgi:signal transduction histidine kinase
MTGNSARVSERFYYQVVRLTGYVPWGETAGNSAGSAIGPAMTTLRSTVSRVASVLRCAGLVCVAAQVVIWRSFYVADPWRLAGPIAAIVWGGAAAWYLYRRWPTWQLACADSAFYASLALTAAWCVPAAIRGEASSWLVIVMVSQIIVPTWAVPAALSVPLTLASPAAYLAGTAIQPPPDAAGSSPAAAGGLLLVSAAVHWCGRRVLYGRATEADVALADADRDAREQYVVLSRSIERREHERLLHDTVLNTLTALTRAGSGDMAEVISRCQHDVALMESALGENRDDAPGGVLGGIGAVVAQMRSRGLDVHVEAARDAGAVAVPPPVAAAIAHAVREALSNVAAHAGTGEAWIDVSVAGSGGAAESPGGIQVTVRDAGAGFDPDRVDGSRLGLRRSIGERITDWGGRASIRSAPGEGTEVSLSWPTQPALLARGADPRTSDGLPSGGDRRTLDELARGRLPW